MNRTKKEVLDSMKAYIYLISDTIEKYRKGEKGINQIYENIETFDKYLLDTVSSEKYDPLLEYVSDTLEVLKSFDHVVKITYILHSLSIMVYSHESIMRDLDIK
jgi:hypothetical protein